MPRTRFDNNLSWLVSPVDLDCDRLVQPGHCRRRRILAVGIVVHRLAEGRHQRFKLRKRRFKLFQLAREVIGIVVDRPIGSGQYPAGIVSVSRLLVVNVGNHIRQLVELLQRRSVEALAVELGQVTDWGVGRGEGEVQFFEQPLVLWSRLPNGPP